MRVLLVADGPHFFLKKYLQSACFALKSAGHTPLALWASEQGLGPGLDEALVDHAEFRDQARHGSMERLATALSIAASVGADHVHLCFFNDPGALLHAARLGQASLPPITVSIFGLGVFRESGYEAAYNRLIADRVIVKTLLHSNNPGVAAAGARAMGLLDQGPVRYLHDPIYDDPAHFTHAKVTARARLGIDAATQVVLYYGTFPSKKGADLLLEAASHCTDPKICFLFAGSLSSSAGSLTPERFALPNVRLDDRVIDEVDTGFYFCAADLIALPYRRYYEFDTSGVFVQSCLARRRMLVPNFSPFRDTVNTFDLGGTFRCEDSVDLATRVMEALSGTPTEGGEGFGEYIATLSTWADFASAILET